MDIGSIVAWAAVGVAAAAGAYGALVERFKLQVKELELAFPNLPGAFDGYTILHLSDLHITGLGRLERLVMDVIGSRPVDACVVTGDVTAEPRASDSFRRLCSVVPHRDPIFMVLGNSEHKPWLDTGMLIQRLSFECLQMLVNSSAVVGRNGESIRFVGVDDAYSGLAATEKAFQGVDPGEFVVFLTHCPSEAPEGIQRGADLVLAGHTHGGQVRLPLAGMVWTHMRRHKPLGDGLYTSADLANILKQDVGSSMLLVSRGVGTSRIPIRLNCPPEVFYITLRKRMP